MASGSESLATTTAVARPCAISLAKEGPLRKANSCVGPSVSDRMSCIMASVPVSMPLLTLMMGVLGGMCGARSVRNLREYCTGTAWMMKEASRSASSGSVVARIDTGSSMSDR